MRYLIGHEQLDALMRGDAFLADTLASRAMRERMGFAANDVVLIADEAVRQAEADGTINLGGMFLAGFDLALRALEVHGSAYSHPRGEA